MIIRCDKCDRELEVKNPKGIKLYIKFLGWTNVEVFGQWVWKCPTCNENSLNKEKKNG